MKYRKKYNNISYSIVIAILIGLIVFYNTRNTNLSLVIPVLFWLTIKAVCYSKQYYTRRKCREKLIKSGINIVDKMNGEEFEVFLLTHFERLGYKGHTTAKSGDYGADLVLIKDNEKIVVQAKRWKAKVGIEAIQQVIGAKSYYKASKCIVITNNFFTPNAWNLAKSSNVELWDREKLLKIMNNANGQELARTSVDVKKIESRVICPKCGAEMKLRKGKYGEFYGCSSYPKCKYTNSSMEQL